MHFKPCTAFYKFSKEKKTTVNTQDAVNGQNMASESRFSCEN